MHAIETLMPGLAIRLTGNYPATVEENPRDGVWLLARCRSDRRIASDRVSLHGLLAIAHRGDEDVIVVHADDILEPDADEKEAADARV